MVNFFGTQYQWWQFILGCIVYIPAFLLLGYSIWGILKTIGDFFDFIDDNF